MLRRGEKVLPPVLPSAAIAVEYRRRLYALLDEMADSYEHFLRRAYRANEPEMAQDAPPKRVTAVEATRGNFRSRAGWDEGWFVYVDGEMLRGARGTGRVFGSREAAELAGLRAAGSGAVLTEPLPLTGWGKPGAPTPAEFIRTARPIVTPARALNETVSDLGLRWQAKFDETAPRLAEWFAKKAGRRSETELRRILSDGGVSVRFQYTPAMRDLFDATVAENVGLIKSISSQYHTDVQGMVMRSVASGRDLASLTRDLEGRYDITRRRAALIARDQNNKATAVLVRARQSEVGVTEAIWLHSHGGKEPRKTHLANDGKRYDVTKGWFDPDPKVRKRIWPGELINCKCVSRSIVKGFS